MGRKFHGRRISRESCMTSKSAVHKVRTSYTYRFCMRSLVNDLRLGSERHRLERLPVGKKKTHFNDFQELFWPIYAADRELLQ